MLVLPYLQFWSIFKNGNRSPTFGLLTNKSHIFLLFDLLKLRKSLRWFDWILFLTVKKSMLQHATPKVLTAQMAKTYVAFQLFWQKFRWKIVLFWFSIFFVLTLLPSANCWNLLTAQNQLLMKCYHLISKIDCISISW